MLSTAMRDRVGTSTPPVAHHTHPRMVQPRLRYVCCAGGVLGPCRSVLHTQDTNGRWYCEHCGARWRGSWPVILERGASSGVPERFFQWCIAQNIPLQALPNDVVAGEFVREEYMHLLR